MSEPRQKRRALGQDEDVILELYPDAVNARFIQAVEDMNAVEIKRALDEGADKLQMMNGFYPSGYLVQKMSTMPYTEAWNLWRPFIQSLIVLEPQTNLSLIFMTAYNLNFQVPPWIVGVKWLPVAVNYLRDEPEKLRRFITTYIRKFNNSDEVLKAQTSVPGFAPMLQNYPTIALRYIAHYVRDHDNLSTEQVLKRCATEPLTGYDATFEYFKNALRQINRHGLEYLNHMPYRYWMSFIMAYLYGVKSMQNNELAIMIPYVIETGDIPVAGHMERVRFYPNFDAPALERVVGEIRNLLAQVAQKCHNDPRVREMMEREFAQ